jgi:hypothetical protein
LSIRCDFSTIEIAASDVRKTALGETGNPTGKERR